MPERRRWRRPHADPATRAMSVREAGRKGGKTTRDRYGTEFFQEIGAKGGKDGQ